MSQHDYNITTADATTGQELRVAVNEALQALASNNSGATAPNPSYPHQFWPDETAKIMKQRDATNAYWISLWPLAGTRTHIFVSAATSPYTVPSTALVIQVDCADGNVVLNMPLISTLQLNQRVVIDRVDNSVNTLTLMPYDGDSFIEGGASLVLPVGKTIELTRAFNQHRWLTVNRYTKP